MEIFFKLYIILFAQSKLWYCISQKFFLWPRCPIIESNSEKCQIVAPSTPNFYLPVPANTVIISLSIIGLNSFDLKQTSCRRKVQFSAATTYHFFFSSCTLQNTKYLQGRFDQFCFTNPVKQNRSIDVLISKSREQQTKIYKADLSTFPKKNSLSLRYKDQY